MKTKVSRHVGSLLLVGGACALAACGPTGPDEDVNENANGNWNQNQNQWPPGDGGVNHNSDGAVGPACAEHAKYVYVVDDEDTLYRFDPQIQDVSAFTTVGTMSCGSGQPNSMSVGRDGYAYVLFGDYDPFSGTWTCDGVYKVDIQTAECLGKTPFSCGSGGFEKFGMGFATLGPNTTEDQLYIGNSDSAELGTLDVATGAVQLIGNLPNQGGEFTGNANGELWGFFPYEDPPAVLYLDKSNASVNQRVELDTLPPIGAYSSAAWAFAFWGGDFFVFYQVDPPDSSTNVYKLAPEGQFGLYIADTGLRVVGAGVSTCAPVIVE